MTPGNAACAPAPCIKRHAMGRVLSRLNDARQCSLCHALNAMQCAEYCQGCMTPGNAVHPTACTKRHALCVTAMHYAYAMHSAFAIYSTHSICSVRIYILFIYSIHVLYFKFGSSVILHYMYSFSTYVRAGKQNSALLKNKRNPNIDCQSVLYPL
jgi:hypothetical protein